MKVGQFLKEFAVVFCVTFLVAALVSLFYALVARGTASVDWAHSVRLAIILAVALPILGYVRTKR